MPLIRCQECEHPVAEVRGQTLIIRSRHHGHQHVTVIPLAELIELTGKITLDTVCVKAYSLLSTA